MRRFERCLMALAAACALAAAIAVSGARAGPREDCRKGNEDTDLAIQACTKLIRANRRDADAFHNRAVAYFAKRFSDDANVDRAIADLTEAIRLNPRYALTYANRGRIYSVTKHDYDLAIADLSEAIKLDPKTNDYRKEAADAYRGRGRSHSEKEDYDRAISDYSEAIKIDPKVNDYIQRGVAFKDKKDYDRALQNYNEAMQLDPSDSQPYFYRALIYQYNKVDYDRAIADYGESIKRSPSYPTHYQSRGKVHALKGDYDRAIADYDEVIRINPKGPDGYRGRAEAHEAKKDYDRAIADYGEAIRLSKGLSLFINYRRRSDLYVKIGDYDSAIGDTTAAISIDDTYPSAYHLRGEAYRAKRQYDSAIADFDKAIARGSQHLPSFTSRGKTYEEKGELAKAIEDYNKALALEAKGEEAKEYQAKARRWLAALQAAPPLPAVETPAPAPVASAPPGRRVALVIGNAAYKAVAELPNPRKDAREVAAALRDAGFAEVVERYDLGIQAMRTILSAFEDLAKTADWAVVYYGGHGIEVDGRNFLVPVDVQLKRDSDVEDETLPLDRVLARVSVARKLQLVILDACRDNPFARRMAPSGRLTRSIGTRGLARIEYAHPNLMIAYSARAGEAALDGPAGGNSPYAKALVKYLAEPQLELGIFFRKVRGDVLAASNGKQRPFEDSSLTDSNLFFRNAAK